MVQAANNREEKQTKMKLTFVGDTTVGKTALLMAWTQGEFPQMYVPTVIDIIKRQQEYEGKVFELTVRDTAGHDDLGRLRPIAYINTDCFVICFDLTQPETLDRARTWWLAEAKCTVKQAPCILVGCKLDLREYIEKEAAESGNTQRLQNCISKELLIMTAKKCGFEGYFECSAKELKGLDEVFNTAFEAIFKFWGDQKNVNLDSSS